MRLLLRRGLFFSTQAHQTFGLASRIGGSSQNSLYNLYAGHFHNHALQKFKQCNLPGSDTSSDYFISGATLVTSPDDCKKCMQVLMKTDTVVAWDTETMDLDIKNEAPVGKGSIICASFFAGPQYNFGSGPRVFIDNFGTNAGLINYFREYLESEKHLKVWHNYGFDRHLFYNHGINVRGFGGDTMHMARMYDSGKMFGQYSLAALTKEYKDKLKKISLEAYPKKVIDKYKLLLGEISQKDEKSNLEKELEQNIANTRLYQKQYVNTFKFQKTKIDQHFKKKKILKTGGEGASYQYPTTLTLHTNIQYLKKWIQYSLLDSESTFYLRQYLEQCLKNDKSTCYKGLENTWKIYEKYWRPFGQLLTDIQREGIKIDFEHMQQIELEATRNMEQKRKQFIDFLMTIQDGKNIDHFNPSSCLQLQQLLHAPYDGTSQKKQKQQKKATVTNYTAQTHQLLESIPEGEKVRSQSQAYQPTGRKLATFHEVTKVFKVENLHYDEKKSSHKKIEMEVKGLGIPPLKKTPLGIPSVDESVLQILAGNPEQQRYGTAYDYFNQKGDPTLGKKICKGLKVLLEYRSIETLLKNFIQPLTSYADKNHRIHASLNINTETGRLSCKKPNLQNQPALDKDIYKIRKAFIADTGKKLIVADYGQLELRVLAHLSNCKAMIEAFKSGGDFHSRTAIGMYDYIRKDIEEGNILLEWDKSKGKPPVPLLKDKYAVERKKAKTVNFSIAYGKTAKGFAADWSCSLEEAKKVIKAWFKDRPQVEQWQKIKQDIAEKKKFTQTLLGRYRRLDKFFTQGDKEGMMKGMRMRRAINTPIQGGAADIVIAGMINISRNKRLQQLGWKILMQIHDQLILQGPEESSVEALGLIKYEMQHPFEKDLLVSMEVDAKIGNNWYECK